MRQADLWGGSMHKSFFPAVCGLVVLGNPIVADAQGQATPGRPAMNPGQWIHMDDYPTAALFDGIEGTTAFYLTYDAGGSVTGCKVTQSSGSAVLDETTCALLNKRARFEPGRDGQGRSVGGAYSSRVRWILPKLPLPTEVQTNREVEFDFSEAGELEQCRVVKEAVMAEAVKAQGRDPCRLPENWRRTVFVNDDGKPIASRTVVTVSVEFQRR
jgi:TonB family protein